MSIREALEIVKPVVPHVTVDNGMLCWGGRNGHKYTVATEWINERFMPQAAPVLQFQYNWSTRIILSVNQVRELIENLKIAEAAMAVIADPEATPEVATLKVWCSPCLEHRVHTVDSDHSQWGRCTACGQRRRFTNVDLPNES
jgi:hypothetical protein